MLYNEFKEIALYANQLGNNAYTNYINNCLTSDLFKSTVSVEFIDIGENSTCASVVYSTEATIDIKELFIQEIEVADEIEEQVQLNYMTQNELDVFHSKVDNYAEELAYRMCEDDMSMQKFIAMTEDDLYNNYAYDRKVINIVTEYANEHKAEVIDNLNNLLSESNIQADQDDLLDFYDNFFCA